MPSGAIIHLHLELYQWQCQFHSIPSLSLSIISASLPYWDVRSVVDPQGKRLTSSLPSVWIVSDCFDRYRRGSRAGFESGRDTGGLCCHGANLTDGDVFFGGGLYKLLLFTLILEYPIPSHSSSASIIPFLALTDHHLHRQPPQAHPSHMSSKSS